MPVKWQGSDSSLILFSLKFSSACTTLSALLKSIHLRGNKIIWVEGVKLVYSVKIKNIHTDSKVLNGKNKAIIWPVSSYLISDF